MAYENPNPSIPYRMLDNEIERFEFEILSTKRTMNYGNTKSNSSQ
jgi:hypothetical protein